MSQPSSYCQYVQQLESNHLHTIYHDTQYGFPIEGDDELFGRLILEINQAGLSWLTVLKKQDNFREAFSHFNVAKIAAYDESDLERLLDNPGIIRNKLKINAVIHNAQQVLKLQKSHGSFHKWLQSQGEQSMDDWVKLFKKTFKFTGGEITKEFLMSSGYIEGAHVPSCPCFSEIAKIKAENTLRS